MEAAKETKFGTEVAYRGRGWCLNVEYAHSAEKARDTTLDNENGPQHVTCVVVTAHVTSVSNGAG